MARAKQQGVLLFGEEFLNDNEPMAPEPPVQEPSQPPSIPTLAPTIPIEPPEPELEDVTEAPAAEGLSAPEPLQAAASESEAPSEPAAATPDSFALFGYDLFGNPIEPKVGGKLSEQFTLPPFSVLDARQGYWQERKRAWLSLGIKSELGRGAGVWVENETGGPDDRQARYKDRMAPGGAKMPAADYSNKERGDGRGRAVGKSDGNLLGFSKTATIKRQGVGFNGAQAGDAVDEEPSGTSIFDPVLCELSYRWFCPPGGTIIDPFAGGSVRGIVACMLGQRYIGVELSARQCEANREQAETICKDREKRPLWINADSLTVSKELLPRAADFLFSCPPYGDLEVYSDSPNDISNMTYDEFCRAYVGIIGRFCEQLRNNRFAAFVVGDYRDERGLYRNFVSATIDAFHLAGLRLYNEAILVTAVGSLPIRIPRIFNASRKLGKTHQNYLMFVKGNPKLAAEACNGQLELP